MAKNILMPEISPTTTEGTLAKWYVKEGDRVAVGDVIAEVETDKVTLEIEAVEAGTLGQIVVPEATPDVKVNDVIAVLLEEGEGVSTSGETPAGEEEQESAMDKAAPAAAAGSVTETLEPIQPEATASGVAASPLASRMAAQAGIDLSTVRGSGPGGRVVKADIVALLRPPRQLAAPPVSTAVERRAVEPAFELQPLTPMRKTVAQRLTQAKQQIPHFYMSVDCKLDTLLELREKLNRQGGGAYRLTLNDLVIKAAAMALRQAPAANAAWTEQGIKRYQSIDIAVAVAVEGGLLTPVIRAADGKGLEAISTEMKQLADKAREGKLMPEEYQGGTFSISNLGMYGIKHFDAVINPPQACILAVGAGEKRPVVKDDALGVATVMTCTLSVDHRVVDGAVGAKLLNAFKMLVENPLTMLL